MNNINEVMSIFELWIEDSLPRLSAQNAVDIHVDELLPGCSSQQDQLEVSVKLFQEISKKLTERLNGYIVMLMIPLLNCESIDVNPPDWVSIPKQMSRTPPSIYVMRPTAMLQMDPSQRFLAPVKTPIAAKPEIAVYYQCWRNLDDPADEGWSRDLRVVTTQFL